MGQRHQLFVVGRIGQRYRVLAAVHHQWSYGEGAVRRCLQTLRLLQSNAPLLRQELQAANDYEWESLMPRARRTRAQVEAMTDQEKAEEDAMTLRRVTSFPMVTTCLKIGAAKNQSGGYNRVHILPITLHPCEFDNNDGYTIFDITDPEQPRYCFMVSRASEPYDARFVEAGAPISASSYLFLYKRHFDEYDDDADDDEYDDDANDDDMSNVDMKNDDVRKAISGNTYIQDLHAYHLITRTALLSTWPEEKMATPALEEDLSEAEETSSTHQSLRAKAMEEVISHALQSDTSDLSWLNEAKQLPDFARQAFARLVLEPAMTAKPAGLQLLCHALMGCQEADLSHFGHLTSMQILHILSELRDSSGPVTLTLPNLKCLTAAEVRALAQSPGLVDIRFGYTPNIDLAPLIGALSSTNIRAFSHPELYKSSLVASDQVAEDLNGVANACISKMMNDRPIIQAVYFGTKAEISPQRPQREVPLCNSGSPAWGQYFSTFQDDERDHYSAIGNLVMPRATQILPMHFSDVSLCTQELLPRLYKAIATQVTGTDLRGMYGDRGISIAMSLATGNESRIAPLPRELYCSYMAKASSSLELPPKVRPIVHGEWTLVVCQEKSEDSDFTIKASTVRHCLVTRSAVGELMSHTLEEFLDITGIALDAGKLAAELKYCVWPEVQAAGVAVSHCDVEEAHEAIKATEVYNSAIETAYVRRSAGRVGCRLAS